MSDRVLFTGHGGFVGHHCLSYFLEKTDWELVCIDSFRHKGTIRRVVEAIGDDSRVTTYKHDLTVPIDPQLENLIFQRRLHRDAFAVDETPIDYIINMASDSAVERSVSDPTACMRNNYELMINMLEFARRAKGLKAFIHISCYDEETRLLTPTGFKAFHEVRQGETILTLNPESRILEEKEIEEVIVQDYDGPMYHFDYGRVNLKVTPNHRMYFQTKNDCIYVKSAEEICDKSYSHRLPNGNWRGIQGDTVSVPDIGDVDTKDLFHLCGMYIGDGFSDHQIKHVTNKSDLSKQDFLVKARGSDGRFATTDKIGGKETSICNSYRIWFDIPECDPARKKLTGILVRLGVNFTEQKNKSGEHVYFGSKPWYEFFKQFGRYAINKHIPNWMLKYDGTYLEKLLEGLIDSDGKDSSTKTYTTISKTLVRDCCELGIKLGYYPSFKEAEAHAVFYKKENRSFNGKDSYCINFCTTAPNFRRDYCKVENYQGKIWCCRVRDNKNLIVERGGKVAICGNTDEVYGEALGDYKHKEWDAIMPSNPYCMVPETQILTQGGPVSIESILPAVHRTISKSKSRKPVAGVIKRIWKFDHDGEVCKIRTRTDSVTTTIDHRFFVRANSHSKGGTKIVERRAEDIKVGDRVLCFRKIPFPKDAYEVENQYARFLGYWLGDGSYSTKTKYVRLADQKLDFIKFYHNSLFDLLGVSKKASTKNFGNIYKHSTKDCWYLQFASEELRSRIDLSSRDNLWEQALNWGKKSVVEFAAGFFDAEANYSYEGSLLKSIAAVQSRKDILDKIQFLLRRIGIVSRVRPTTKNHWRLTISDAKSLTTCIENIPSLKLKEGSTTRKPQKKGGRSAEWMWDRVESKVLVPYSGPVYDLEIDKHHNYAASYFVVHNSASKAAQEALAISYWRTYDLPVVIVNIMNIIGERQDQEKFLPKIISKIAKDEEMPIYGCPVAGYGSRCYLHARNVADALIFLTKRNANRRSRAIFSSNPKDHMLDRYNICGDADVNNLDMAKMVAEIMGKELKYKMVSSESARPGYDRRYMLDGSKLKGLGWTAPMGFRESLERIVAWTLENQHWLV